MQNVLFLPQGGAYRIANFPSKKLNPEGIGSQEGHLKRGFAPPQKGTEKCSPPLAFLRKKYCRAVTKNEKKGLPKSEQIKWEWPTCFAPVPGGTAEKQPKKNSRGMQNSCSLAVSLPVRLFFFQGEIIYPPPPPPISGRGPRRHFFPPPFFSPPTPRRVFSGVGGVAAG